MSAWGGHQSKNYMVPARAPGEQKKDPERSETAGRDYARSRKAARTRRARECPDAGSAR